MLQQLEQHEEQVAPVLRWYKASMGWAGLCRGWVWRGPAARLLNSKAAAWFVAWFRSEARAHLPPMLARHATLMLTLPPFHVFNLQERMKLVDL